MIDATDRLFYATYSDPNESKVDLVLQNGTVVAKSLDRLEARQIIQAWRYCRSKGALREITAQAEILDQAYPD